MENKNIRMNMIKIFALGIKYANSGIVDDDFFRSNMFEDLFDDGDEPATFEQIMTRLDNISCSYIEEKQQTSRIPNKYLDEEDINTCIENIKSINKLAKKMTREEVDEYLNYDYEYSMGF